MALTSAQQWWVRVAGSELNGGGFDSTISGAGTNYADQDSPQVSVADFAAGSGSTTLTSATAGFTSQMVGNILRLASGTNALAGYYAITAFTNSTTVTLDRTPTSGGALSSGVGRIGGAHAFVTSYGNGGDATPPLITSPLAAGHIVNIRGSGSRNPSSADYTMTGFCTFPVGDTANGRIRFIGYNGRPFLACPETLFAEIEYFDFQSLYFKSTGTTYPADGFLVGLNTHPFTCSDCYFDVNGNDIALMLYPEIVYGCTFANSGSTSAGTSDGININGFYCTKLVGNTFLDYRGSPILVDSGANTGEIQIVNNIIARPRHATHAAIRYTTTTSQSIIYANTLYGGSSDGIAISTQTALIGMVCSNNTISGFTGVGLNITSGTAALNDRCKGFFDYNNFFSNTGGDRTAISAGAHDTALDPQFTNTSTNDFTIGTNLKAKAFPHTLGNVD
jgi:hypothetical protein